MSTDLEFRRDLPEIARRPAIKLEIPRPSTSMDDDGAIPKETSEAAEECCHTPTSAENKIPAVLQCPPAPRKRKRIPNCKRRLTEIEFFEILHSDELEPYFASSFEIVDGVKSAKRSFCECK